MSRDYYGPNGGVIFPNPNAPTGIGEPLAVIEDILEHNRDSVVIIDEAYVDFGGSSALPLIDRYDNLLVVQTFSKSRSMAGLRIGFAVGAPELIKAMNDVHYSINSYTMNLPAQLMGAAALEDQAYFKACVSKIIKPGNGPKRRLDAWVLYFRIPKLTLSLRPIRNLMPENCFMHCVKAGFMCVISISPSLTAICELPLEQMSR